MEFSNDQLALASTTWKILWLELNHTDQERFDKVRLPTQELLDELSSKPPPTFICLAGEPFMSPDNEDGVAVKIFFVGPNNRVAYLGTLLDPLAHALDRQKRIIRLLEIDPESAIRLAITDPRALVPDPIGYRIRADSDVLDTDTATRAVKKFLVNRAPKLVKCAIEWLPNQEGIELVERIKAQAKAQYELGL
ncbi:MAG: hypothetical protein A3D44_01230 [Candidatus Staskawiczbacteria bacterium RIFCSPHIGHO2_02_FULL_42_22]|uniref:Uncharacterized protein n=1 Tax=Candidatus Staskawiczbacteria bacterium RIFCSPHIGHO2_02_FULL_42_22 TaxID=1802207 RepID=A0A1G2I3B2_9BACT|nr:MAG: hypothetical protein A3D44_01230 [Candidatus Staskawiczbacteria bacterium RIFCSPHIGHO2_02_FULL_42_22]